MYVTCTQSNNIGFLYQAEGVELRRGAGHSLVGEELHILVGVEHRILVGVEHHSTLPEGEEHSLEGAAAVARIGMGVGSALHEENTEPETHTNTCHTHTHTLITHQHLSHTHTHTHLSHTNTYMYNRNN